MTPEERVEAIKAQWHDVVVDGTTPLSDQDDVLWSLVLESLRAAIIEEREACAKIAEDHLLWVHQDECYEEIAAAIRPRP